MPKKRKYRAEVREDFRTDKEQWLELVVWDADPEGETSLYIWPGPFDMWFSCRADADSSVWADFGVEPWEWVEIDASEPPNPDADESNALSDTAYSLLRAASFMRWDFVDPSKKTRPEYDRLIEVTRDQIEKDSSVPAVRKRIMEEFGEQAEKLVRDVLKITHNYPESDL